MEQNNHNNKFGFAIGSALSFGGLLAIIIGLNNLVSVIIIIILAFWGFVGMGTELSKANTYDKNTMSIVLAIYTSFYAFILIKYLSLSSSFLVSWLIIIILMILNGMLVYALMSNNIKIKYLINLVMVITQILYLYLKLS